MTVRLLKLYEPAVNAVIDVLDRTLVDYVDAVNATLGDAVQIACPTRQQLLPYVPPIDHVGQQGYPTIGVGRLPGAWRDDLGYSATGVYGLSIVCFLQDGNQDVLQKKADRTLQAVVSCLLAGRPAALGDGPNAPYSVTLKGLIPGATLGDRVEKAAPPKAFVTWTGFAVEMMLDEDGDYAG